MLNGYDKFVTKEILNTFNDDRTYLYLCHLNGYKLKPCTKYSVNACGNSPLKVAPRSDYKYCVGQKYDDVASNVVKRLSGGLDINKCFNLFNDGVKKQTNAEAKVWNASNELSLAEKSGIVGKTPPYSSISKLFQYYVKKNIKHDIVYVLGNGSKYDNLELKISITSMLKYCSHWINNIYVVGENPHI